MTARPPSPELLPWATSVLGDSPRALLVPVAGDASARRYFRLHLGGESYILVASPPASEKNPEFLAVRELLEAGGVTVPALVAADLERGFILLGDLGDRLLLAELSEETADTCYRRAFEVLVQMSEIDPGDPAWPAYDQALLSEELSRFPRWFVSGLLGGQSPPAAIWQGLVEVLVGSALEQPQVFVHRDFHSRNLMPQGNGSLGVIDFQDAVIGPLTYDPVSLLRDCYIRWRPAQVEAWALAYLARQQACGRFATLERGRFLCWFDLTGLQRHIKVLGTFARLYLRDGKSDYLEDLPRVLLYVREILEKYSGMYPEVAAFRAWFQAELEPLIARQPWSAGR